MSSPDRVQSDTEILIGNIIKTVLKREPVAFDFKVVAAIVRLLSDLPSSHGRSSVVATLKGTGKMTKKNPLYGFLAGVDAYKTGALTIMTDTLITSFEKNGLMKISSLPYSPPQTTYDYVPEWIIVREFAPLEGMLLPDYIEAMAAEYGEEKAPERYEVMKPLTIKEVVDEFLRPNLAAVQRQARALLLAADSPLLLQQSHYYNEPKLARNIKGATASFCMGAGKQRPLTAEESASSHIWKDRRGINALRVQVRIKPDRTLDGIQVVFDTKEIKIHAIDNLGKYIKDRESDIEVYVGKKAR